MKKMIIKGIKRMIRNYKLRSDEYIPIYSGEKLIGFGRVSM